MNIQDFVRQVVDGEHGSGSVYVSDFDLEDAGVYCVGVCTDSEEPTYESDIPGTDENIRAVETALDAAGLSVITDCDEWDKQLRRWHELGGGW